MRFQVAHQTRYRYSRPVFLEPLTVRLRPRVDYRQRLLQFALNIDPMPAHCWEAIDFDGNCVTCATFCELTESLAIMTSFVAETDDANPYGFLLRPEVTRLPLESAAGEQRYFEAYTCPQSPGPEIAELARRIACEVNFSTLMFVTRLNEWIYDQHAKIDRPVGDAWRPSQTLSEGRGACRDLAMLLIETCRVMNIPSRFVSGYSATSEDREGNDQLHAWAEVYLPGAGWRGFDPSLGLATTEQHLAVAAGAFPALAAPTSGHFRGEATSHLEAQIALETTTNFVGSEID